ncbi:MAG: phospholipid/cholesterol/gamma-HCH transport system substrate-binding protein [Actinomycetota bacterium]|jgi:virulence factor Mce-like protein|nr:phospholipid/cholesterol/gamma-HCH transport system substrate-binding protein [Actinomycetota bacterium]
MSAPLVKGAARARRLAAGVAFLAVIGLLVALSVGLYTKAFTKVVTVSLQTDRVGNQLSNHADVKLRGIRVGEVRSIHSSGQGATIELALSTGKAGLIPSDVSAQLLPKTLFGEKEVDLIAAEDSTARPIRTGDVITQDRSKTSIETERVLNDFLPLLQSLKPAQLSLTLNAVATGLRGRGERLGHNLALNDDYFRQLNPELPAIMEDFRGLADVSESYAAAAPDLLRLVDNSAAASRNLVDQNEELATFLASTGTFAQSADDFLRINQKSLVDLAAQSRPMLQLYKQFSPEYACMLHTLPKQEIVGEKTFGGIYPWLHITLETTQDQGAYLPGDEPKFREDRGPTCFGLTGKPVVPMPAYYEPKDGYCDAEEAAQPGVQTGNCHAGAAPPGGVSAQAISDPVLALGGPDQRQAVGVAVAPVLQLAPDEVPDIATLLFGPLARGGTIGYRAG